MHTENKSAEVENSVSKQDEIDEFGMTPKQRKFADCYIKSGNATQAAIEAGYSEKTARSQGQRLLTNVDIKKYVIRRYFILDLEILRNGTALESEGMK